MKHSIRNLLAGILVLAVISGITTWSFMGQIGTATAGEKGNIRVADNESAKKSDGLEVSALLKKLNMEVAADRTIVPDFELSDLEGNKVRLSDFRGETVLLGFFTTW